MLPDDVTDCVEGDHTMEPLSVISADLDSRIAGLSDGSTLPITNLIDVNGDMTDDPDEAQIIVCGNDDAGWFVVPLALFDLVSVN